MSCGFYRGERRKRRRTSAARLCLTTESGRWTTQDPLGFAAGDANLYRYVGNMATMATDPSGNLLFVPVLVVGGAALAVAGLAGMHYSAYRYDYAREHDLSRPIQQWTPEVQAEYRDYVRTTNWLAVGSTITAVTVIVLVSAGATSGLWLRPRPGGAAVRPVPQGHTRVYRAVSEAEY